MVLKELNTVELMEMFSVILYVVHTVQPSKITQMVLMFTVATNIFLEQKTVDIGMIQQQHC